MLRYVFLGLVQGLTEFLPVSSSAHILLVRHWLGMEEPGTLLVAFLHLGTLFALGAWFWRDILWLAQAVKPQARKARGYLWRLTLGLAPLFLIFPILQRGLEKAFSSPQLGAGLLFVTAGFLLLADRLGRGTASPPTPLQAVLIGLAQAVAVLPGISRAGATVAMGLFLGLAREEAFRFSFLLGIPTIFGAAIFALLEHGNAESWLGLALGALSAFVFGFVGLGIFRAAVLRQRLWLFSVYCLLLGTVGLILV